LESRVFQYRYIAPTEKEWLPFLCPSFESTISQITLFPAMVYEYNIVR